jgi:CBS domain-containing protein
MKKRVVKDFRPYEAPATISEDVDLMDIVHVFINNLVLHNICVVDSQGRLSGLINRKRIFKAIFSHHVGAHSRVSNLLHFLTAETSGEIMVTHIVTATEDDSIDDVIRNMIDHNIREIPILDKEGGVIGFITLLRIMEEWAAEQID